jgi:hypothetical protein
MHNLKRSLERRKEYIRCNVAFSCDNWTKYFGENGKNAISAEDQRIEKETLPDNICEILNSECPAFPGKKVSETHMLVFIPKSINGEPLTLKSLGKLAKQHSFQDGYRFFWPDVAEAIGNKKIDKSGWRLMTTDVLEGSRNKRFDNPTNDPGVQTQQQCVAELAEKARCDYVVPSALDAAACILAQYFKDSHTRLFSTDPWTYTRCQENVTGYQVVVGGFAPSGLSVNRFNSDDDNIGVAALRKF